MPLPQSRLFVVILIAFGMFSSGFAEQKQEGSHSGGNRVSGTIQSINPSQNSLTVRVGDANTAFSFDNKTVFTYGQDRGNSTDMKIGDRVIVTSKKGKAEVVNATKRVVGTVQDINHDLRKLTVKIGPDTRVISFDVFQIVRNKKGSTASYLDIKKGDTVTLFINLGFAPTRLRTIPIISAED